MEPWTHTGILPRFLTLEFTRQFMVGLSVMCISYGTVSSQRTPVGLGCTFSDHEHVYNVELVPGEHKLPCPDTKALKQALKVIIKCRSAVKVHSDSSTAHVFPGKEAHAPIFKSIIILFLNTLTAITHLSPFPGSGTTSIWPTKTVHLSKCGEFHMLSVYAPIFQLQ